MGPTYWPLTPEPHLVLRRKCLTDINMMVIHRGLSALESGNPIALYGIASYRRTSKEEDRVYAIGQVFGFKLGASAGAQHQAKEFYNRFDLEVQLGSKILEDLPVLSQLHVFTEPVELGRGWRVSAASRIRDLDLGSQIASIEYQPACTLKIKKKNDFILGAFTGKLCSFEKLRLAWCHDACPSRWEESKPVGKSPQQIFLDVFLSRKEAESALEPHEIEH